MLFGSVLYMIILPAIMLVSRIVPKKSRYVWLLVCSLVFWLTQSEGFILWLILAIAITYVAGLILGAADSTLLKKITVGASCVFVLSILFIFKYLNFSLALTGNPLRFEFTVPLGISFYTFQSISYIVDVYRDPSKAERNPLKLALFLSFFLSVVSGPVNRAGDMIPQFTEPSEMSLSDTKTGMQKMLWGYFLKLAIAGRLTIVVDNVYADCTKYSGFAIAFTALAYLFMLYCDFEGYSQIVIGSGYMLGIKMKENFRQPFFSSSMGEVWRRWHVSLSSWFRDYLYIPLGGNRHGTVRKYVNIFIVLVVSGIWHGANMTFVIWGALNGAYIILGQILIPCRDRIAGSIKERIAKSESAGGVFDAVRTFLKRVGVYILTAFTFIFFSNKNVTNAWFAVKGILMRFSLKGAVAELTRLGLGRFNLALTLAMVLFVLVADSRAYRNSCDTPSLIKNIPTPVRWAIYYALLIAILFSANLTGKEFIYSRM